MEPLSWALWTTLQRRSRRCRRRVAGYRLQALGRAIVTWAAPYDAMLTPALAQPPLPIGALDPCGPDPLGTFERSGHFTPYTAISNVTGSPAISLPLYAARRRPAARRAAHRPPGAGGRAARARRAARGGAAVGATARPRSRELSSGAPSTAPSRAASRPATRRRRCRGGEVIETSSSSASSQVAGARDFMSVSTSRRPRLTIGVGTLTSGRARPAARSDELDDLAGATASAGRRARSARSPAAAAPPSAATIAVGDVVGPDRLVERLRRAR